MLAGLNAFAARLVDGLLFAFRDWPPLAGLTVASLLAAVMMLVVVRATSDQAAVRAVKRSMRACLLEVRLFNDDFRAMLRALVELFGHSATYLRLSIVPAACLMLPLSLAVAQMHSRYGYTGLNPGQQALVKVRMNGQPAADPVLEVPQGLRIQTPAVSIPSLGEIVWRVSAEEAGDYAVQLHVDDATFSKSVTVSSAVVSRSPVRARGLAARFLYPAERPLPTNRLVESIEVTYPRREIRAFGWDVHWMAVFFGLSTAFAFAMRRLFGVTL